MEESEFKSFINFLFLASVVMLMLHMIKGVGV